MDKKPVLMRLSVPFITRKASFDGRSVFEGYDPKLISSYVMALAVELKANTDEFSDCEIKAIRIDGGCASIIGGTDIDKLMRLIRQLYTVAEDAPVSIECSPADINGANMPFFNRSHLSRYDLELISLEPDDFRTVDALNYMEQLPYISHGFLHAEAKKNMGFVLLAGKKHVSKWGFRRSVLETVRRPVSHVSFMRCAGEDAMSDEEFEAQYAEARELLTDNGYTEYIPLHWAKPGCEDRALAGIYAGEELLGFGLNAVTKLDGAVSTNTGNLDLYLRESGDYTKITADCK